MGSLLGKGSFGNVYKATRLGAEYECALKVIAKGQLATNSMLP